MSGLARGEVHPVRLWAIDYGSGHIDPYSVRRTRKEAIAEFTSGAGWPDWSHWRKQGCRAIRVVVSAEGAG